MSRHCNLRYSLEVFLRETDGIGESKHSSKKVHGGISPKIHSYGARTRYFGIAKDFVNWLNQKGIKRVNQVKGKQLIDYLLEKAQRVTEETMRTNIAALKKYFLTSPWKEGEELSEILDSNYHLFLSLSKPGGMAKPFSDPEKVIEKLSEPESRAIALIQYLSGGRIDDVPKVVEGLKSWRKGDPVLISIRGSKGGRDRLLDFSDRPDMFEKIREAVAILSPRIQEKGWRKVKEDHYRPLRRAVLACGETYTGSHAFRVNYAQRFFHELVQVRGLSEKEALQRIAKDLGHNRISVARAYIYR